MANPATGRLPMPHLVVFGKQLGKTGARHGRQPSDELSAFNTAVGDVLLDDVNPDALGSQLGDVLVDARGLGLSLVAKGQPGGVLPFHCVVDRVTAQEHVDAGASALQRMRQPDDGVVLLFQRGAICRFDDAEYLLGHGAPPQRVGITSVLSDSSTNLNRSAGLPRRRPSIASAAPRSSTQSPHCTQSSLLPFCRASANSAAIQFLGFGWASCSTSRPCTALGCGACLRSEEHTSELQSRLHLVCRLLLEKKKNTPSSPLCGESHRL